MPKRIATENSPPTAPAAKPSAGLESGPRNTANTAAASRLHANATAKIRAGCDGAASGSIPASRHQARLNNGPYQSPPSANADTAAARIASQLRSGMFIGSSPGGTSGADRRDRQGTGWGEGPAGWA